MPRNPVMRAAKWLLVSAAGFVLVLAVLYAFFGLRYMPDGSGRPGLGFLTGTDEQAEEIERHRAAQRLALESAESGRARTASPVTGTSPPASEPADGGAVAPSEPVPADMPSSPLERREAGRSTALPYWTDVRGPARDGRYLQRRLLQSWPAEGLNPMWKQPVGGGYASFVAANGRAFTIEQRGRNEVVAAYEIETGRELWTSSWPAFFQETMGGNGPRATPTWSGGLVYALGATGELRCLDESTGRVIWRVNILDDNGAPNLQWGMAASPLIVDNTVVVLPGGSNGRSVVAYEVKTGRRVWSAQDDPQAYSSPMLARVGGREQLIVLSGMRLMGLTANAGDLLWSYPWRTMSDINVSQPLIIGENRVFVSSGYNVGAAVIELIPRDATFDVREVWRNNRMKNKFTSSVLHEGFIYGLDEAILACVDAATGDLRWKGGRYGYGQLLLAGDRLIVLTEEGDLVLVGASPSRHQELARFNALEGRSWNHLAIDDGRLLVRNTREMAAFDLRAR